LTLIAVKLILTPVLISAVTIAQRRWGATIGGLLVSLPLTSGPVAFFFAVEHGTRFAATAAVATLAELAAVAVFCLAYARVSHAHRWPATVLAASGVFVLASGVLRMIPDPVFPTYIGVLVLLVLARAAVGASAPPSENRTGVSLRRDLPGRFVVATGFVLVLTATAATLGPHLSGLLSPVPIYAAVVATFTHRLEGAPSAQRFLRAVITGLFAFATFFLVLALALDRYGIGIAFLLATATSIAIQTLAAFSAGRGAPTPDISTITLPVET
jgi:hypothetical protein